MILPSSIKTQHKIRDLAIIRMYADGFSLDEVGKRFKLSGTRVGQIVYRNRELLELDKRYEKVKRISHLKSLLKKHPETLGKKGTLDIIDQLRVETEGNKLEHTGEIKGRETKVVVIVEKDGDTSKVGRLPTPISIIAE